MWRTNGSGAPLCLMRLSVMIVGVAVLCFQASFRNMRAYFTGQHSDTDKIQFLLAQPYEGGALLVAPETVMEQARLSDGRILLPYGKRSLASRMRTGDSLQLYPYGKRK